MARVGSPAWDRNRRTPNRTPPGKKRNQAPKKPPPPPLDIVVQCFCHFPGAPRNVILTLSGLSSVQDALYALWERYAEDVAQGNMYCAYLARHGSLLDYILAPAMPTGQADVVSPPLRPLTSTKDQVRSPYTVVLVPLPTTQVMDEEIFARQVVEREEVEVRESQCRIRMEQLEDMWRAAFRIEVNNEWRRVFSWELEQAGILAEKVAILEEEEMQARFVFEIDEVQVQEKVLRHITTAEWSLLSLNAHRVQEHEWTNLLEHAEMLREMQRLEQLTAVFNAEAAACEAEIWRTRLDKQLFFDMALAAIGYYDERPPSPPPPPKSPRELLLIIRDGFAGSGGAANRGVGDNVGGFDVLKKYPILLTLSCPRGAKLGDILASVWRQLWVEGKYGGKSSKGSNVLNFDDGVGLDVELEIAAPPIPKHWPSITLADYTLAGVQPSKRKPKAGEGEFVVMDLLGPSAPLDTRVEQIRAAVSAFKSGVHEISEGGRPRIELLWTASRSYLARTQAWRCRQAQEGESCRVRVVAT